jgi:predicted aldo/keto reductase-like oxidoreductase
MKKEKMTQIGGLSRRDFLKVAGATGMGPLMAPLEALAELPAGPASMPTRPFGKTGVEVPILSFGGSLHLPQLMLNNAFKWGVTYLDTANTYMGGNSERRIGKFFAKYPEKRKKIFLVTKSHGWTLDEMSADLNTSLERMKTDYIDLFFAHGVSSISELDEDTRRWAEKTKAQGKIRFFGFSTHSNMEECLLGASKLGWIDGIMMTYNYRLMHSGDMKRAVDACAQAGMGLTEMQTQAGGSVETSTENELELAGRFLKKGFTEAQAKLKAVWENPNIASICSEMPNMDILMENVSAALDRTRLSESDLNFLHKYAHKTRSGYCRGCAQICEATMNGQVPIGDIMRALMYGRSYGDRPRAISQINKILPEIRRQMTHLDYSQAEKKCPHQMAIGKLIAEALKEF